VRTSGDDSGLTANDVDFQFPFYGYVEWDDSLGVTPGTVESVEITAVNYSGIPLENITADWTKRSAPYGGTFNPAFGALDLRPAAAYFTSETDSFGNIATAGYGDAFGPNLVFNNDDEMIAAESIAHWDQGFLYGGTPAYLAWAMYPGHKSVKYNGGGTAVGYYGEGGILWEDFIADHDIQAGRDLWGYLRSDYSFTTPGEGRTVDFDYDFIIGWNADMNRNGVQGEAADKFPMRCRFFSDVDAYDDYFADANGYPNFWPDDASFLEGGCYLTDTGDPNYPVQIFDDEDETDPKDNVNGTGPDYDVDLFFEMAFGTAPFTVELDWDYDFIAFGNSGHTLPVGVFVTNGKKAAQVNVDPTPAGGNGNYFFAMQVVDSGAPTTQDEFFWPDAVPLVPAFLFFDNMSAYTTYAQANAAGWLRGTGPGHSGAVNWHIGPQWEGGILSYSGQAWHANDGADGTNGGTYNGVPKATLRSPIVNAPAGSDPWLHFRANLGFQESTTFDQFWCGWDNSAAANNEASGTWNQRFGPFGNFDLAWGNTAQTTLRTFNISAPASSSFYLMFSLESLDGVGNAADGVHLDPVGCTDLNTPDPSW
jgi:hypothetical protein